MSVRARACMCMRETERERGGGGGGGVKRIMLRRRVSLASQGFGMPVTTLIVGLIFPTAVISTILGFNRIALHCMCVCVTHTEEQ